MGVAKKNRKFGQVKRLISLKDNRLKQNKDKGAEGAKAKVAEAAPELIREMYVLSLSLSLS